MFADVRLQNFRSYDDASFEFSPGVNIIVGPNASGKTNLLEAVLVLSKGKSYRAKDADLVQFKQDWLKLSSHLSTNSLREVKITPTTNPNKVFVIDDTEHRRLSIEKTLPLVLFEPNQLQLLSASPQKRRDYLDDLLEQITPGFDKLRRQYIRSLTQRNSLLKSPSFRADHMFPWDLKISELAGQIVKGRVKLINLLNENIAELYKELSKTKTKIKLHYNSELSAEAYETELLKRLEKNIQTDRLTGFTSAGPHREDFTTMINDQDVQVSASRGEARTIVLGLKITELKILEENRNQKPLLLLDDVFSELDGARRHSLVSYLKDYQVFVTTTDADLITKNFINESHLISTQATIGSKNIK
jgi:DNA replication and repair protein RecF